MASATMATMNHVLKDAYVGALEQVLGHPVHKCGSPYKIGFLDSDGSILRRSVATDSYEATIFARCENESCRYHSTLFNYARFALPGHLISSLNPRVLLEALDYELRKACDALSLHLESLHTVLCTEGKAEVAEVVTRLLAARGSCLMSEIEQLCDIDGDTERSVLLDFLDSLGFVSRQDWRVPVAKPVSVFEYQSIPDVPPSFETHRDVLLALPADHPLATTRTRSTRASNERSTYAQQVRSSGHVEGAGVDPRRN